MKNCIQFREKFNKLAPFLTGYLIIDNFSFAQIYRYEQKYRNIFATLSEAIKGIEGSNHNQNHEPVLSPHWDDRIGFVDNLDLPDDSIG